MVVSYRKAFTMLELVFVIVVIGILSAIAVPKFQGTSEEAYKSRAVSVVHALRSIISTERQKNILRGQAGTVITNADAENLLSYGLDSGWSIAGSTDTFTYTAPGSTAKCAFKINGGKLEIDTSNFPCDPATGLNNL